MDPPVKPEGDGGQVDARTPSVPPASSSFAGLTGESICGQRAGGVMDPPVKPEGDGGGVDARTPSVPPAPASFAGLTGESICGQRAGGPMDPPVKPEGDGGWGGARAPSTPPASSSFAGSTGESICGQRAGGAMDPPVRPEGDGLWWGVGGCVCRYRKATDPADQVSGDWACLTDFQILRLDRYSSTVNTPRKISTPRPICLRCSMCGSAAQVRKVTTS